MWNKCEAMRLRSFEMQTECGFMRFSLVCPIRPWYALLIISHCRRSSASAQSHVLGCRLVTSSTEKSIGITKSVLEIRENPDCQIHQSRTFCDTMSSLSYNWIMKNVSHRRLSCLISKYEIYQIMRKFHFLSNFDNWKWNEKLYGFEWA